MAHDVAPPLPSLENQDCEGGFATCGMGDSACQTKAEGDGLVYVLRHGGVGYYCKPDATRTTLSGFSWGLIVVVLAIVSLIVWRVQARKRKGPTGTET